MATGTTARNGGKRKPAKTDGRSARERARIQAARQAAQKKRRNLGLLLLAIVVVVAGVGIGIGYATNFGRPRAGSYTGTGWGAVSISDGKPIELGDKHAPVTLRLYEDFRCPHCAQFEQSLGDTITALQKSGKVKIELYPLTVIDGEDHQQGSLRSGNAMAAAAKAGFGEAYYNGLWANYGKEWTDDQLIDLADQVAGDKADKTFDNAVKNMAHQSWMSSIDQTATTDQVDETPTMFINDKREPENAVSWTPQQLRDAVAQAG